MAPLAGAGKRHGRILADAPVFFYGAERHLVLLRGDNEIFRLFCAENAGT